MKVAEDYKRMTAALIAEQNGRIDATVASMNASVCCGMLSCSVRSCPPVSPKPHSRLAALPDCARRMGSSHSALVGLNLPASVETLEVPQGIPDHIVRLAADVRNSGGGRALSDLQARVMEGSQRCAALISQVRDDELHAPPRHLPRHHHHQKKNETDHREHR